MEAQAHRRPYVLLSLFDRDKYANDLLQPQEKPIRNKRGHRKPDFLATELGDGRPGSTFIQQGPVTLSPSSDAFSHTHTHPDPLRNSTPQAQIAQKRPLPTNGTYINSAPGPIPSPVKPRGITSPFDIYCSENGPILAQEHAHDPAYDIDGALARGWSTLDPDRVAQYVQHFEQIKNLAELSNSAPLAGAVSRQAVPDLETRQEEVDEDTEMADDTGTPAGAEAGGFTAVNKA